MKPTTSAHGMAANCNDDQDAKNIIKAMGRPEDISAAPSDTDADRQAEQAADAVVTAFGRMVPIALKILAGIIVLGLIMTACAMIIGIIVISIRGKGNLFLLHETAATSALGISVGLMPVLMMIYVLMCLIASRKPGGKTVIGMFILWVAAIATTIALVISGGMKGFAVPQTSRSVIYLNDADGSDSQTESNYNSDSDSNPVSN